MDAMTANAVTGNTSANVYLVIFSRCCGYNYKKQ